MRTILSAAALTLLLISGCATSSTWPSAEAPFEQIKPTAPLTTRVTYLPQDGRPRGSAVLRVHIGKDGAAKNVSVVQSSGFRNLDQAAMEVAWSAKYQPFLFNGTTVEVTTYVPVSFN